jgi:hypothetical protein
VTDESDLASTGPWLETVCAMGFDIYLIEVDEAWDKDRGSIDVSDCGGVQAWNLGVT